MKTSKWIVCTYLLFFHITQTSIQAKPLLDFNGIEVNLAARVVIMEDSIAQLSGLNVQDANGVNNNQIVVYNNPRITLPNYSFDQFDNQLYSATNGEIWVANNETDAHNIVDRDGNDYSRYGSSL